MIVLYFYRNEKCYVAEFALRIHDGQNYGDIGRNPLVNNIQTAMLYVYPGGVWRIQPFGSIRCRGRMIDC